ncbi:MAG: metalloregulator ArsR/SmtB family transcription factor [Devosia sp.]
MSPVAQFSALADETRCRIVGLLHEGPRPVHELAAAFEISRPAISRHLRLLREADLVVEVKQGRENVYSLRRHQLKRLSSWLDRHWGDRRQPLTGDEPQPQMELDF